MPLLAERRRAQAQAGAAGTARVKGATVAAGVAVAAVLPVLASGRFAPRLVYNNDLTNIESCNSSFHRGVATTGPPFTLAMLEASVEETAGLGVDVHELAPGCCFVPWWNNASVISIPEHVAWWTRTFNHGELPPNRTEGFMEHLMRGGDIIEPFLAFARARKMRGFVSWRMNDAQAFANYAARPLEDQFKDTAKFWFENRHDPSMNLGVTQNWASRAVREYKASMLRDVVRTHRPDGISLDFLRAPVFFNTTATTAAERRAVMGAWVRALRAEMRAGGVPVLAARVPPSWQTLTDVGLDVVGLLADGTLDYVTLGVNYFSFMPMEQDTRAIIAAAAAAAPGASVLWEVTYVERDKPSATCHHGPDQRMTAAHLAASAMQAHALGAAGVATFNFQYYRPFADVPCMLEENEPYTEPPFALLPRLVDHDWLASANQLVWSNPGVVVAPAAPRGVRGGKRAGGGGDGGGGGGNDSDALASVGDGGAGEGRGGGVAAVGAVGGAYNRDNVVLTPPKGGWVADGRLRVTGGAVQLYAAGNANRGGAAAAREAIAGTADGSGATSSSVIVSANSGTATGAAALASALSVTLNGVALTLSANTSALWPSDQPDRFNGEYAAWAVPLAALRAGNNSLVFSCAGGAAGDGAAGDGAGVGFRLDHWELLLPGSAYA